VEKEVAETELLVVRLQEVHTLVMVVEMGVLVVKLEETILLAVAELVDTVVLAVLEEMLTFLVLILAKLVQVEPLAGAVEIIVKVIHVDYMVDLEALCFLLDKEPAEEQQLRQQQLGKVVLVELLVVVTIVILDFMVMVEEGALATIAEALAVIHQDVEL
jgi:hypothetical protein